MAYKSETWWYNSAGSRVNEITADGVYVEDNSLLSTEPIQVTFSKGSGADPVGATIQAGLRFDPDATPEAVDGAVLTLPSLDGAQASLPVLFYPKGRVCLTVTGFVAPFKAARLQ